MYIEAMFRDPLHIYVECTLFVYKGGHIVGVLFGSDSIDILEHETKSVW